ncbi:MAG TPA: hypothetical protein PKG60_05460 [Spirochaetota bacterium]|nr:hypothetical protein [Spirochaetota bacterium]HPS87509.1 hypothetical protein [Spirochaetota bacterium]
MLDIIIVGIVVALSIIYFVIKIVKFIRRPAGTSGCGCSSSDCSKCPMCK